MDELLINPQTKVQLRALVANPPHALLITGPTGIGKYTVAHVVASLLTSASHISTVTPDEKGSIGIDVVRSLYQRTRSRTEDRQVVVIDHAETMGIEAQNAFLKLLEEPRDGVLFILTATTPTVLLPTIASRVQTVNLPRVSEKDLTGWLQAQNEGIAGQNLTKMLFIASGRPATAARLIADEAFRDEQQQLMQEAKQLLGASTYDRLQRINDLCKDRVKLIAVLEAMAQMVKLQMLANATQKRWHKLAEGLEVALSRLAQNGNAKAQVTELFVNY
ncbi:MAG: AAA family ATPase [Candidatus Saccharimonadales bacterium]